VDLISDIPPEPRWFLATLLVALGMIAWRMGLECQRRRRRPSDPTDGLGVAMTVLYVVAAMLVFAAMGAL
jgi:hypothetical protein